VDSFISLHVKTIPNYLNNLISGNTVPRQLILIKFQVELGGIELLPVDHGGILYPTKAGGA